MLAPNVLVVDTDVRHWLNLLGLMAGEQTPQPSLLLCLLDGDRCLKALHSKKGVLWGFVWPGDDRLDEALAAAEADALLALPRHALPTIFAEAQAAVTANDNYVKQLFDLVAAVVHTLDEMAFWYPAKPFTLNLPPYEKVEKIFNKIWPDDTTMGFFVFENSRPFTSLLLGKEGGQISLITTLDALGQADQSLDFRHGYQTYADWIAEKFNPLYMALFIELSCFRELRTGGKPLSYLKLAEKRQRALLWPKPWKVRWLLWLARVFKGM